MSGPCTTSKYTEECKPLCQERWLPEEIYDTEPCKEFDDIQIYGNSEVTNTTLTELGGTTDATAEAFDYKEAHIVPAKCKNGEIIGYHVFYSNFREDKPVLQIGKDKLDEFKNNYDVYTTGGGLYYVNGEPTEGMKKAAAGSLSGNWSLYWEGLKQEWKECLMDPTCAATIVLSSVNGVLSQFKSPVVQVGNRIYGSGPSSGIIEVSERVSSVEAFKNYTPPINPLYNGRIIEFIYDTESKTFLVGKANNNSMFLSPHQKLAYELKGKILDHHNNSKIVGGFFKRENSLIILDETSGHFWQNYSKIPTVKAEITDYLKLKTNQKVIWK